MNEIQESLTQEIRSFEERLNRRFITFRRLSVITTFALIFRIILMGWLRAINAKPLCPEWPSCFGRWIPPCSASDLPLTIIPEQFNFTLAWLEFALRLSGLGVFALIIYLTYYAIRHLHHISSVFFASIAVSILLMLDAWIGSQYLYLSSASMIISLHTGLIFITLSLLLYLTYHAYLHSEPAMRIKIQQAVSLRRWLMGIWMLSLFQVVMGCEVRLHFIRLIEIFPLQSRHDILYKMTGTVYMHGWLGFVLTLFTAFVCYRIIRLNGSVRLIRIGAWSLAIINLIQLIVGVMLITLGVPEYAQILHLLLSSLFIGNLVILFLSLKPRFF
jgi:cytochrome c oxidase assembly protein subunit 15